MKLLQREKLQNAKKLVKSRKVEKLKKLIRVIVARPRRKFAEVARRIKVALEIGGEPVGGVSTHGGSCGSRNSNDRGGTEGSGGDTDDTGGRIGGDNYHGGQSHHI